jgi:hypothetical protein
LIIALVFGLVALIGGGVAAWFGRRSQRRAQAMAGTATIGCADARSLVGRGAEARAECVGSAGPGADGLVVAPYSGRECVWYRSTTSHHYWDWQTRQGRRERVRKQRTIAEQRSDRPFTLSDESGSVLVDGHDAHVDHARQVVDEFQDEASTAWGIDIGGMRIGGGDTIGFQRQEWVIDAGERLYVLGGVAERADSVALTRPDAPGAELFVSTRSEKELVHATRRVQGILYAIAGVAVVAGVALLILAAGLA